MTLACPASEAMPMPIRMEAAPAAPAAVAAAAADTTAAAAAAVGAASELPEIKSEIKAEDFCELTPAPPQQQQLPQQPTTEHSQQQQPPPLQSPDQQHLGPWVGQKQRKKTHPVSVRTCHFPSFDSPNAHNTICFLVSSTYVSFSRNSRGVKKRGALAAVPSDDSKEGNYATPSLPSSSASPIPTSSNRRPLLYLLRSRWSPRRFLLLLLVPKCLPCLERGRGKQSHSNPSPLIWQRGANCLRASPPFRLRNFPPNFENSPPPPLSRRDPLQIFPRFIRPDDDDASSRACKFFHFHANLIFLPFFP